MIIRTSIALAATLALAAPAAAQATMDWDTDASGGLSRDEWDAGMGSSTTFGDWDANADSSLDSTEFSGGLFSRFDADGDGRLSEQEWEDGFVTWHGEAAGGADFASWDSDGDGAINREEFVAGYDSQGLFDGFRTTNGLPTTNPGLTQEEFSSGMYGWMDRNRDDNIDADENLLQSN